jgi:hypothetical protein
MSQAGLSLGNQAFGAKYEWMKERTARISYNSNEEPIVRLETFVPTGEIPGQLG